VAAFRGSLNGEFGKRLKAAVFSIHEPCHEVADRRACELQSERRRLDCGMSPRLLGEREAVADGGWHLVFPGFLGQGNQHALDVRDHVTLLRFL